MSNSIERACLANIAKAETRRQTVVDLVEDEIQRHRDGELQLFTTDDELMEVVGVGFSTIVKYTKTMPQEDYAYRRQVLTNEFKSHAEEHRSEAMQIVSEEIEHHEARVVGELSSNHALALRLRTSSELIERYLKKLTRRQQAYRRHELNPWNKESFVEKEIREKKETEIRERKRAKREAEQERKAEEIFQIRLDRRYAARQREEELLTNLSRYEIDILTDLTHQQREEVRRNHILYQDRWPNGIEQRVIDALFQSGVYREYKLDTPRGLIYYPGLPGNRWYTQFEDGTYKIPDFKVKGVNKIIEIWGDYWHQPRADQSMALHRTNPSELVRQYGLAGIECMVVWYSEIERDQDFKAFIQRVVDWIR
ncbi:hypothetical protein ACFL1P_01530 [Patescibacteria group bacterium]